MPFNSELFFIDIFDDYILMLEAVSRTAFLKFCSSFINYFSLSLVWWAALGAADLLLLLAMWLLWLLWAKFYFFSDTLLAFIYLVSSLAGLTVIYGLFYISWVYNIFFDCITNSFWAFLSFYRIWSSSWEEW